MGKLANHIANIAGWGAVTIETDSLDINPPGGPSYKMDEMTTQKDLLEMFDRKAAALRTALAGASDEHLIKPWSLLNGGQTVFTMPRVAVLRSMIMNHSIHHRAQLGVYLRLNDIPVPATYGPTADEQ